MGFPFAAAGSVIGAGLNFLSAKKDREAMQDANAASEAFSREQWDWNKERITNTVKDAENAGIHPLYALGAQGISAPTFQIGVPQTGSAIGDGIAQAGAQLEASVSGKTLQGLQEDLVRAQIKNTEADTMSKLSEAARATQAANHVRASVLEEREPLSRTPLNPNDLAAIHFNPERSPMYATMVDDHGREFSKFHSQGEMDEMNQGWIAAQLLDKELAENSALWRLYKRYIYPLWR